MLRIQLPRIPLLVPRSRRVVVGIEWRPVEDLDAPPTLAGLAQSYWHSGHVTLRYVRRRVVTALPVRVRSRLPGQREAEGPEDLSRLARVARRALPDLPTPLQVAAWPLTTFRNLASRGLRRRPAASQAAS